MPRYRIKAAMVDPKQFTGGEANAKEITDWIVKNGGTAKWWEPQEHAQVQLPERISFITADGLHLHADVGDWIIKRKNDWTVFNDTTFQENYEIV